MARILHVITGLGTGGAESMLYSLLCARSAAYEHCVVSLTPSGPMAKRIADLGVPVHSLNLHAAVPSPLRMWGIRSLTRQIAPDLIAGWMYHGNLMASLAGAGEHNLPVIWVIQSSLDGYENRRWRTKAVIRLGARFSYRPKAIIYASRVARTQHEAQGYCASSSLAIPNGVDCQEFIPDPRVRVDIRNELGLNESHILIGLVARRHPIKDQPAFVRAAATVARNQPLARFLLVGRGIDRDLSLRRLIQELSLDDRVLLFGERSDIPRINAALDIVCCSSLGEAFSRSIGEAMACEVPCVVTDVGDNAYLIGETGICVPPRDPEALAGALNQLISAGPTLRKQWGSAARRRIEENFSLPAVVARYEEFFGRYVSSSATARSGDMEKPDPALRR